jgi:hypothetical protein
MKSSLERTIPGASLLFEGTILNVSGVSIVDAVLYARVSRRTGEQAFETVDQFIVDDSVSLTGRDQLAVAHEWRIPNNAEGGDYHVSYYLVASQQFELYGILDNALPHQAGADFSVDSDNTVVHADPAAVTINGQSYVASTTPYVFQHSPTTLIEIQLTNPSADRKTLPLQWNQYARHTANPDNRTNTKTEVITLEPGETKTFTYSLVLQPDPNILVTATVQDGESKRITILNLVRDQSDNFRLTLAGFTGYPLEAGKTERMFACLQSFNSYSHEKVTLKLALTAADGTVLHEYTYEGRLDSDGTILGEEFPVPAAYGDLMFIATLSQNGIERSKIETRFNCDTLPTSRCKEGEENSLLEQLLSYLTTKVLIVIVVAAALLLLLIVGVLRRKKRRATHDHIIDGIEMTTPQS